MTNKLRSEAVAVLILLVIPVLWFAPVLTGQRTLLPADNLYAWEPWRSFAAELGVETPHNELLSDLILENYAWKRFVRASLQTRQLPLWNPYLFSGMPFLADAQHSALYPFSVLFWILPLEVAYGWFSALQIALAGLSLYAFARVLRLSRSAALFGGVAYMLSGFLMVSVVFTMMIAAAAWLPALLACIEVVIRKQEEKGNVAYSPVPYIALGSVILGVQVLAGHIEITYYVLIVAGFYAAWRLVGLWRRLRSPWPAVRLGIWLLAMVGAGLALAGIQLLPLIELAQRNFRQGSVSYADVVGWAWPKRQILTFFLPDVFGNPSHHGYWDLWTRQWVPATANALGEPIRTIFWGVKNYVEGGNYLGLLTLALAALGTGIGLRQRSTRGPTAFFVILSLIALANAFGTPLYALFYYGLPWYKQVHSPFRWVFPLTLAAAMLAALGVERLRRAHASPDAGGAGAERLVRALAWLLGVSGAAALALVGLSTVWPAPFIALGQRLVAGSDLAQMAFADGRMFWSYQAINLIRFGALAGLSALTLGWATRGRRSARWPAIALAVLVLDLWLAFGRFNPAVDPRLLHFTPPSLAWLQQQQRAEATPWRFTTFNAPGEKTLNANAGWLYDLYDVRGYGSIIPKQYADYMERIQPQSGELLYNRIAPIYTTSSGASGFTALNSPWLSLLAVRYVVTTQSIPLPSYELAYDGEVRIYRNRNALPRAFVLRCGEAKESTTVNWYEIDPRTTLVLDAGTDGGPYRIASACVLTSATFVRDAFNEVEVAVDSAAGDYLVLADAYFPGWKAYLRPADANMSAEAEVAIARAYGNFRVVALGDGEQIVHFKYTPMSVKLGLYVSFLAAMIIMLTSGWWAWGRFYREREGEGAEVRRVAKNSLIPMSLSLVNKAIDFAFAMLRLRILSPAGEGSYTFAITFYAIFEILVRFGLGTLLTRDVARERAQAGRYLSNVLALRVGLWLLALPLMLAVGAAYRLWGGLTPAEGWTIALFALALLIAGIADAFSAMFNAYEKMEYPAGVATATAVAKVMLGTLVLLPPLSWGFVGLAGVSVLMNIVQTIWLYLLLRQKLLTLTVSGATPTVSGATAIDRALQKQMLSASWPLMINHLLATIFFRIDVWILKPLSGAGAVGLYGAAYKYIDGLNVIPAYFTLAIFPLMARLARDSHEAMARAYILALRLLLIISLPIAVLTTFLARPLILLLGGEQFLPGSAWALQILIWSIPIGFVNSVTQYVLIAVDQQRFLTRAFAIGVAFNVVTNLIFIPRYSYLAAAATTIFSELALLIPFYYAVRRHVAPVPWIDVAWRPALAAAAMGVILWGGARWSLIGAAVIASLLYIVVLLASGTGREADLASLLQRLPGRHTEPRKQQETPEQQRL